MFSRPHILPPPTRALLSRALLCLAALAGGAGPTQARARLEGPVTAQVVRVIDGDTIEVRAQIWLEQEIVVKVRLAGIDTPELSAACAEARTAAELARDLVIREVEGARVMLSQIHGGKYFGRVIGRVQTPKGQDLSALLIASGLAVPYAGGRRQPMC